MLFELFSNPGPAPEKRLRILARRPLDANTRLLGIRQLLVLRLALSKSRLLQDETIVFQD